MQLTDPQKSKSYMLDDVQLLLSSSKISASLLDFFFFGFSDRIINV